MPSEDTAVKEGGKDDGLVVISILKEAVCADCGRKISKHGLIRLEEGKPYCIECADLGELIFLPRGDTALTRRSKKYSKLSAVVLEFSRSRNRYERQGLLVEEEALEKARDECESDEEKRARQREKAAVVREVADKAYLEEFTQAVREAYPSCPADEANRIALHACEKYSGRVGRSAMAKKLDDDAVTLAVRAHIRHEHTSYDDLLNRGVQRNEARSRVLETVDKVATNWRKKPV